MIFVDISLKLLKLGKPSENYGDRLIVGLLFLNFFTRYKAEVYFKKSRNEIHE
jgi:hypothetical protein